MKGSLQSSENAFQSDKIDQNSLADALVAAIKEWFDKKHNEFLENISSSEKLVESGKQLSEKERMKIKSLYPKVALHHMHTLDVVTRYKYRGFKLDTSGSIGSGGQGEVFQVLDKKDSLKFSAKKIESKDEDLHEIATAAYLSSYHPNLVHVVGVKLSKQDKLWTVELYMELMHCDVWNLMRRQKLTIEQRMRIGLELAKALQFLHSNNLTHRDVNLSNLLVSQDLRQVKLFNFGLTKGIGFVGNTFVGEPKYVAPELIRGEGFNMSADIFSLGITLWYLFEGSGEEQPAYAERNRNIGAIITDVVQGCRPTRLDGMPDDLWDFMTKCWDGSPDSRPNIDYAVAELQRIADQMCH